MHMPLAEGSIEYSTRKCSTRAKRFIRRNVGRKPQTSWNKYPISALVGSVSQLVDLGLVKLPKEKK